MDKNTKLLIQNIINNEELYTLTKKSKKKLQEIQKKYELLINLIDDDLLKSKINQELVELLEMQNEYFAIRTNEIVSFTANYIKFQQL